jgi:hypothetical protein
MPFQEHPERGRDQYPRVYPTPGPLLVIREMTLPVEPEDSVWHKDPVFCLACVTTIHIINSFTRCSHDPVAFAQLKADAPTEWSFSSLEEDEGTDDADWWKTHS